MLSPLYLFAIHCKEKTIEKFYYELSVYDKIIILPKKTIEKLKYLIEIYEYRVAQRVKINLNLEGKIIFYPVEPTHIKQMLPVSSKLNSSSYIYITNRLEIYKILRKSQVKCLLLNRIIGHKPFNYDFLKLGSGFISEEVASKWVAFCKVQIEKRYDEIELSVTEAIKILKPRKIVIGYDITPEGRFCVYYCEKHKIPTICIQHGSIAGEPMDGEHIVKYYLLYGLKAKEYLANIGNNSNSLLVFGAPYLDIENYSVESKNTTLIRLGLNPNNKTILVALSGPGHCTTMDHFNQIVKSLVIYAKFNSNVNMIFKLHRKDNRKNYEAIFNELEFNCVVIKSNDTHFPKDIFFWLNIADILITGSSTVALEAMLKSVPVVTIDYKNQYQNIDFIEMNCTYHIASESNLNITIQEALNSSITDKINLNASMYINEYFYTDGMPTSLRIAEWLETFN